MKTERMNFYSIVIMLLGISMTALTSCVSESHQKALNEIREWLQTDDVNLTYAVSANTLGKAGKYMELTIENAPEIDSGFYAGIHACSYAALRLYYELSEEDKLKYEYINVIVKKNEALGLTKETTVFYEMPQLDSIVKAKEKAYGFLLSVKERKFKEGFQYFDKEVLPEAKAEFFEQHLDTLAGQYGDMLGWRTKGFEFTPVTFNDREFHAITFIYLTSFEKLNISFQIVIDMQTLKVLGFSEIEKTVRSASAKEVS